MEKIPNSVIATVAVVLGGYYFNHTNLNTLFSEAGAPGDPPMGNCVDKCTRWLKISNETEGVDPFLVLGRVLEVFMETESAYPESLKKNQERIRRALTQHGLTYELGGRIVGPTRTTAAKTLQEIFRKGDLRGVEIEFGRAEENIASDPGASVTAACALVEALLKTYIADEKLESPTKESIKPLWVVVSKHLGFDPQLIEDDDLKRVLSGLSSIVDGLGSFRTHVGSAHGQGRKLYDLKVRHARLVVSAAHTLALFVIETWQENIKNATF